MLVKQNKQNLRIMKNTKMNTIKKYYVLTVMLLVGAITFAQSYEKDNFYEELGGYVVEINGEGNHGLVISKQNLGITTRYAANDFIADDTKHDEVTVKFKDWRLPTEDEFSLIRKAYAKTKNVYDKDNKPNLISAYYWTQESSSENFKIIPMVARSSRIRTSRALVHVVRAF